MHGLQVNRRCRRDDDAADIRMDFMSLEDAGCDSQILETAVRAGTDDHLIDLDLPEGADDLRIFRQVREGNDRLHRGKIDLYDTGIVRVFICLDNVERLMVAMVFSSTGKMPFFPPASIAIFAMVKRSVMERE